MQPQPRFRIYTRPATYAAILREAATGRWREGESCRELEHAMADLGAGHAVCTARARIGIHLAVRGLIEPGQKVVLSPYTIHDVVNMVICAGGVPVFADIERETCNVDPAEIERLIDGDTGAVLVTHLHGLACDMERITRACRETGVALIEDAAQAFGTRFRGRRVGSFGDAGVFSFGTYKNVNAFFGGLLVTPHRGLADRIRTETKAFRPHPAQGYLGEALRGLATDLATWPPVFGAFTYRLFRYGFLHEVEALTNQVTVERDPAIKRELPEAYRIQMRPLQARLVLRQLPRVDEHARARIRAAQVYHEGLRDVPELLLPPLRTDLSHTYSYFPVQTEGRQALLRHLMRQRRDVAGQHFWNCADLECFSEYRRECPNARATATALVLLPTYPRYALREVERNVQAIRDYFGRA